MTKQKNTIIKNINMSFQLCVFSLVVFCFLTGCVILVVLSLILNSLLNEGESILISPSLGQ